MNSKSAREGMLSQVIDAVNRLETEGHVVGITITDESKVMFAVSFGVQKKSILLFFEVRVFTVSEDYVLTVHDDMISRRVRVCVSPEEVVDNVKFFLRERLGG